MKSNELLLLLLEKRKLDALIRNCSVHSSVLVIRVQVAFKVQLFCINNKYLYLLHLTLCGQWLSPSGSSSTRRLLVSIVRRLRLLIVGIHWLRWPRWELTSKLTSVVTRSIVCILAGIVVGLTCWVTSERSQVGRVRIRGNGSPCLACPKLRILLLSR